MCGAGFTGEHCEKTCTEGYYGQDCQDKCECMNGAKCAPETGQCFCPPGYQGKKRFYSKKNDRINRFSSASPGQLCDRPCDARSYGNDCASKCNCLNGASCHPVTGACLCPAGFGGVSCELGCKPGTYGSGCALKCNCNENNTLKCDSLTGECVCKTSWQGIVLRIKLIVDLG